MSQNRRKKEISYNGILFVFDLDNTLGECSEAYVMAKARFAKAVCERLGNIHEDEVLEHFGKIDADRYPELKTSPERFPGSMVLTAKKLHDERNIICGTDFEQEVYQIGKDVFSFEYPPYPGAVELLMAIRQSGAKIAICTKGDTEIQLGKVTRWNYHQLVDGVHICSVKDKEAVLAAARKAADSWDRLVMIGDTRRDDIIAGNEAGATTVWIRNPHLNKGWAYDEGHDGVKADIAVDRLSDVQKAISHLMVPSVETRKPKLRL